MMTPEQIFSFIGVLISVVGGGSAIVIYLVKKIEAETSVAHAKIDALSTNAHAKIDAFSTNAHAKIDAEADARDKANEALHGRINNIRKEFVTNELYQRDLTRVEIGQKAIQNSIGDLGAKIGDKIEALGIDMRDRTAKLDAVVSTHAFRLGALDKRLDEVGQ